MTFYWRSVDDENFTNSKTVSNSDFAWQDSEDIYTHGLSETSGEYYILVNNSDGNENSVESITLDKADPSVDEVSPSSYTKDSPTVEVDASDSLSGIDKVFLNVTDDNDDEVDSTVGETLDLNNLDDGRYQVEYTAFDRAGNERNGNWAFTVDTVYNASTNVDVQESPGDYRVTDDSFIIPLMVNGSDNDESDIKITCDMDSYSLESGFRDSTSSQYFECAPDTTKYQDMTLDLEVVLEDRAGNSYTEEVGAYTFDRTSPELSDVSIPAEVQNADFAVDYSASDRASGVEKIHYQIDDSDYSVSEGVNVSHEDGGFTVDVEDLDTGAHDLYVWSVDGVGRTSTVRSVDFEYDPSARPELSVEARDIDVTAGERGTVSVNITNVGELFVETVSLDISNALFNRSRDVGSLEPDESTQEAFTFQTSDDDLGVYPVEIETEPGEGVASADITVKANPGQVEELDARLEDWVDNRLRLGSNVTELSPKLREDREERLKSNFSSFNETLEKAIEASENERYWEVSNVLSGIEAEYESAQQSFDEVRDEYRVSKNRRSIAFAALMLVSFSGFGIGYAFYRQDIDIDIESIESRVQGIDTNALSTLGSPVSGAYQSFLELLEEEEEEVESGFQGFT